MRTFSRQAKIVRYAYASSTRQSFVTAATLDPSASVDRMRSSSPRTGLPLSDRDMYIAVTVAWYRLFSRAQRRQHPLGPYVFGNEFTRSVVVAEVDAVLVAHVCAQIACRLGSQWGRGERLQLDLEPREALDPVAAWWRGLDDANGVGVHYVELGGGTLEFLAVARKHNRPNIGSRHG